MEVEVALEGVIYSDKVLAHWRDQTEETFLNERYNDEDDHLIGQSPPSPNRGDHPDIVHNNNNNNGNKNNKKGVLIIVPRRLGTNFVQPLYYNQLFSSFQIPQSVGIIGGKPNNSFYFIGYQGDFIIFFLYLFV